MMINSSCRVGLFALALLALAGCNPKQTVSSRIGQSISTFTDVQSGGKGIPKAKLDQAVAVGIFDMTEGGLVFGGSGGTGIVMHKLGSSWSAPLAMSASSGSFGAQIGVQSQRIVMLFMSEDALQKFLNDGSYFAAGASGSAGSNSGATQASGPAVELYTVGGGLYGGATIGGSGFRVDQSANEATYGSGWSVDKVLRGEVSPPAGFQALLQTLGMTAN